MIHFRESQNLLPIFTFEYNFAKSGNTTYKLYVHEVRFYKNMYIHLYIITG